MQDEAEKTLERDRVRERMERDKEAWGMSRFFAKTKPKDVGADVSDQELVDARAKGMSDAEISASTGLPYGMVGPRIRRAKARRFKPSKHVAKPEVTTEVVALEHEEEEQVVEGVEQHEEVVEVVPEEEPVIKAEGAPIEVVEDPWEGASDLARRHRITTTTLSYRYKNGATIAGRALERRAAQDPRHPQQKWEWRLGGLPEDVDASLPEADEDAQTEEDVQPDEVTTEVPGDAVAVEVPDGVVEQMPEDLDGVRSTVEEMNRDLEDVRAELEVRTRELAETRSRLADARAFIDTQRVELTQRNDAFDRLGMERDDLLHERDLYAKKLTEKKNPSSRTLTLEQWHVLHRLAGALEVLEHGSQGGARIAAGAMGDWLEDVLEGGAA